jgi:hypothetical protein
MSELFNAKIFNGEVFQKYMDRIPNTKLNELLKSRAIVQRQDLAGAMADQVGGNYITTPLKGLIGSAPVNYDGETNIDTHSTKTFSHSRVVVGRANSWTERDFSYDITGGVDFMENIAQQISEYWDEIDQDTLVHILNGVFKMSDTEGAKFVSTHTHDVSSATNTEGVAGYMDGTTLNTAIQKACGDHKGKFSMAIMHSFVATNLENLKLLVYLKYNDANGLQRDLSIGTLNGRLVMVDDSMPTIDNYTAAGVYTVTIGGTVVTGEKFSVAGEEVTVGDTQTPTAVATALASALGSDERYTVSRTNAVLTLTEKSGKYGTGEPVCTTNSVAGTITPATTTEPANTPKYITYVFGDGAIEYTNCGAKVPYEMSRDPKTNGGQDTLYSRQRKCFAPYGISFTKYSMQSLSPTDDELEIGANWELVNSNEQGTKSYISLKAIPIARIISLG